MEEDADTHVVSAVCDAPVPRVLAHLSTVTGMAQWCLGLMDGLEYTAPGLLRGCSRFDGGTGWCRPVVDEAEGRVVYWLGAAADDLAPRIQARVQPGPAQGHRADQCVVTLQARRSPGMDDARWQRLVAAHEVEVLLIQQQVRRARPG
ncbi:MAG: hypothetical protein ACKVQR_01655 [Aquabacterium sp.]